MLKLRMRFSLRMLLGAFTIFALLIGGAACFIAFLFRMPEGVEVVDEISPSPSGDHVAFVAYHGYDDKWSGIRDFVASYTENFTYLESVRLMLLTASDGKTVDVGSGELAGGTIAWSNDEAVLAYVSSEFRPNDNRKRLQLYNISQGATVTAFVGSDWHIRSLQFSPDGKSLAFVENYNQRNLTVLDIRVRSTARLAAGVNGRELCWSKDGTHIFCVRNGLEIWQFGVKSRSSKLIFRGKDLDENYPHLMILSPDGRKIGFCYGPGFHVLDLATNRFEKWFDCRHYFLTFDWSDDGICYLDAVGDETKREARVMVYNAFTHTKEELVTGPFAHVAWLRDGVLIVRKNNAELWELTIQDKATKRLFPVEP